MSPNPGLLAFVLVILMAIAINRSPVKGRTFLFVLGCMAVGFAAGAIIGYVLSHGNARVAGALSAMGSLWGGIVGCITRLMLFRKSRLTG